MKPISAVTLLLLTAAVASTGCSGDAHHGYTVASQYRSGIKTVAVPSFTRGRNVYRRELEDRLTEAVIKRIEADTPYKVTVKERADTLLTGTLVNVNQRILSFNSDTGEPREMEITLRLNFTWTDLRTGATLVEKKDFHISGDYTTLEPIKEDFFQGSENVINRAAQRIVETMEAPW
jgi:hypothetical protein